MRHRYIAVEIDSNEAFDSREFMKTLWSAVSKLYGEHGASRCGLTLISYDLEREVAVVRTVHTTLGIVRAALASVTKIKDRPAALHVITVSGTIKALYKKIEKATNLNVE